MAEMEAPTLNNNKFCTYYYLVLTIKGEVKSWSVDYIVVNAMLAFTFSLPRPRPAPPRHLSNPFFFLFPHFLLLTLFWSWIGYISIIHLSSLPSVLISSLQEYQHTDSPLFKARDPPIVENNVTRLYVMLFLKRNNYHSLKIIMRYWHKIVIEELKKVYTKWQKVKTDPWTWINFF